MREWFRRGLSHATMKNRIAHIRWWAERIDRPVVGPPNGELGIANREYVTNESRAAVLDPEKLARVKDPHVAMSLRLEAAFGLRREEAASSSRPRATTGARASAEGGDHQGWATTRSAGAPRRTARAARRRYSTRCREHRFVEKHRPRMTE